MIGRCSIVLLVVFLSACAPAPIINPAMGVDSPAQVNAELGRSYLDMGKFAVAEAKLAKALQQNPKLGVAHHYQAELYRRTDRPKKAKAAYRRALKYIKGDMSLQNNFGVFLCDQGDYKEAIEILLTVATSKKYRRPDQAYANAGLCALRLVDERKAEEYFRSALHINKNLAIALYNMAQLSFKNRKMMSARAFGQRYETVGLATPQSLLLGVRVELSLGDRLAMENYAGQLSTKFPDSEETGELNRLLYPDQ